MPTSPTTEKGRRTRERIVQAARQLVAEHGVAGVTLDAVCDRAAASKSQLYHYFSGRDELLEAVATGTSGLVVEGQRDALSDVDSVDGLRAWAEGMVAIQEALLVPTGCPIGSLAGQLADHDEGARLALRGGMDCWQAEIRAALERTQDAGRLARDADVQQLAQGLLVALQGGLVLTQLRRDVDELRSALELGLGPVLTAAA